MIEEYDRDDDFRRSIEFAYQEIRRRVANGGPGWREYGSECEHLDRSSSSSMRPGLTINVANRVYDLPTRKDLRSSASAVETHWNQNLGNAVPIATQACRSGNPREG